MDLKSTQFLTIGTDCIYENLFQPIKNNQYFINKPSGGLWSSPYIKYGKYKSEWHEFVVNWKGKRNYDGVVFTLKPTSNILVIDSLEDFKSIHSKYQYIDQEKKKLFEEMDRDFFQSLDFEAISKEYDAILLTRRGESETRFSLKFSLYGWDVETLLVMNFTCIDKQEPIKL